MLARRAFFKMGASAAIVVAFGGPFICKQFEAGKPIDGLKVLDLKDLEFFRAILPVALAPYALMDHDQRENFLKQLDQSLYVLDEGLRSELNTLLKLLNIPLSRFAMTGLWSNWSSQSAQKINGFLTSWKSSSNKQLYAAYRGLIDIIHATYYAGPESWVGIGYPGPLEI